LTEPVALLTGTPGTGKTFATGAILRAWANRHGLAGAAVVAPTGKAAVRVAAAMARFQLEVQPRTVHSLLEIGRNGHDGEGWGFRRNATNPLPYRLVVVDEASMLDTDLAAALLSACAPGTHVLFVGDPFQLPPVGHGAPLRDMIAAGVPRSHLSEIRRNAGMIVEACKQIKDGKDFAVITASEVGTANGRNLVHFEVAAPGQQLSTLSELIETYRKHKFDPLWDIQVLAATNESGPLSRKNVNRLLQMQLNATGEAAPPNPFRQGDKIICLKNGWHFTLREPDDVESGAGEDVYVANGEIGVVTHVQPRLTIGHFTGPDRAIRIPMGKPRDADAEAGATEDTEAGAGCDFDLAYAITCHKSQGSEWPIVIILGDASPGARRVCSREWLYTAVSRASRLCVTIGRLGVIQQMSRRPCLSKRKTFLKELLSHG
jgi:exodeoxyribonuclease V alpha subunit